MHLSTQLFFLLVSANGAIVSLVLYTVPNVTLAVMGVNWRNSEFDNAPQSNTPTFIYYSIIHSLLFIYLLVAWLTQSTNQDSFFQTNKRTRESSTNLETNILTTTRYTAKKRRFRTNYRDILHPILNPTCSSRPHHRRILTRGTNSPKHYIYSSQHTILFLLFLHAFITLWNSC